MTPLERALKFRELCELQLRAEGVPGIFRAVTGSSLATARRIPGTIGDFGGIGETVVLTARSETRWDPSDAIDVARELADENGRPYAITMQRRVGRPVLDTYALMTLREVAALLRGDRMVP